MAKRTGVTPEAVRLAVIRASGNIRQAARALGCSDSTIRYHLEKAPRVMARVRVEVPKGTPTETHAAIVEGVTALLDQSGVERWVSPPPTSLRRGRTGA